MKTYAYAILAAMILLGGLVLLLFLVVSLDGEAGPGEGLVAPAPGETGDAAPPTVDPSRRSPEPAARPRVKIRPAEGVPVAQEAPDDGGSREAPALPRGRSTLIISILDSSGMPLPGVLVSLRSGRAASKAKTGVGGEVVFADLAAGVYSYLIDAPRRPKLVSESPVELGESQEENVLLYLSDYRLAISGRVLNQDGEPVEGIDVVARCQMVPGDAADSGGEARAVVWEQSGMRSRSDRLGRYEVRGLDEGEFKLSTVANGTYPSTKIAVRSGSEFVDLIVVASREVRLTGTVTTLDGEALESVRVIPVGQPGRGALSDADGRYELLLVVSPRREPDILRFLLDGYREQQRELGEADLTSGEEIQLDVQLSPVSGEVVVTGTLMTVDRSPVPGETIQLRSRLHRSLHKAESDDKGKFFITGVQVSSDYWLEIRPQGEYRDYTRRSINVTPGGLSLDVVLEPLGRGELTGQMVDVDGGPVPRFSLWLRSARARDKVVKVVGDAEGFFALEDAPEGVLTLETRSLPELKVSGLHLAAGGREEIEVVIDWGKHAMEGTVVGGSGQAVAGAHVSLHWLYRSGKLRSTATRRTVSDANGLFTFTQLGPGLHRLSVGAKGYRGYRAGHDVGGSSEQLEVRLEPLAR